MTIDWDAHRRADGSIDLAAALASLRPLRPGEADGFKVIEELCPIRSRQAAALAIAQVATSTRLFEICQANEELGITAFNAGRH